MLKKSLLARMQESKDKHGVAYISRFNDGKTRIDENYMTTMIKYANDLDAFDPIGEVLFDMNEACARESKEDFDTLSLGLSLGLMFDGKYVDENKKLREDAEPVRDIVRYYTGDAECFLGEEQTYQRKAGFGSSKQGFINYSRLVSSAERNGLVFDGPRTYDEFKELILMGEPFDISITAGLKPMQKTAPKETQFTK